MRLNLKYKIIGVALLFINIIVAQSAIINIYIDLDNYANETSWTLVGPSGTVGSGGPYNIPSEDIINVDHIVTESGAYTFTIFDSFGDGMSVDGSNNENGTASARIQVDGATEFQSANFPNFGTEDIRSFDVTFASHSGTLLYDHFGVELELLAPHSGGANYSFDWNSFVPTLNAGTANFVESDWYGDWNFTNFGDGTNTIQHTSAPGTADLDYYPSGDEPYDVEAMYFDDDATNLYVVIVTSVPHYVAANGDVGVLDSRISATNALVRPGDLSINTFDSSPRIERNSSEWHYNFGVDVTHENRDNVIDVGGYDTRAMRDNTLGNGLYKTGYDAGGSNNLNPTDSDWYTSLIDGVVEANWEHTNFDPQSTTQTADLSYLGNVVVDYYEYNFGGGLQENGYPTYIYEFTIPRYLLGDYDPCAGDPVGIQWIEGCRNDGNGTTEAISITATADACNYASIGNFVWEDTNRDGIQDGGELGLPDVEVYLYTQTGTEVDNTTTNIAGGYLFANLEPGNYYLKFIPPAGYSVSPQDQGGDDNLDSDPDQTTGNTVATTLSPNEDDITWAAGMYNPNSCYSGEIAGDQSVCWLEDPASFTEVTPASVPSGTILYQWQKSTTDCSSGFTDITGATSATYDSPVIYTTTYFRRQITNGTDCTVVSNCVTVTVNRIGIYSTISHLSCADEPNDGAIDITITGTVGAYTVDWNHLPGSSDPEDVTGLSEGSYTVTITDESGCTPTNAIFNVRTIDNPYSTLILTGTQGASQFPSYEYPPNSFPPDAVVGGEPGGYNQTLPTNTEVYDFTFDNYYIPADYIIDPDWSGTGTVTYVQDHAGSISKASHLVGSRTTEFSDFNPTDIPNNSGDTYYVYGRGLYSFSSTGYAEGWTLTHDFTELANGYLPAGTLIAVTDVDGSGSETATFTAQLTSGASTAWATYFDNSLTSPPHGAPTYLLGTNAYFYDGPATNNGNWVVMTTEDLYSVTVNVTNLGGGSIGLKFAAPLIPFNVTASITQQITCVMPTATIEVTYPLGGSYEYSIDGGSLWQSSTTFNSLSIGNYNVIAKDITTGCEAESNSIVVSDNCVLGSIGDYVWLDSDLDGTQNDGGASAGIENVKLTLFDGTSTSVGETYTNTNGWYEFIGLLADNYTIIVDDLTLPSEIDVQTYDYDGLVSPHAAQFTLTEGEINLNLDFGYGITPLPVTLSDFNVEIYNNQVKLTWATQSEVENQGFFVNRKLIDENEWEELSNFLENPGLRGQGSTTRKTEYEFVDSTALSGFNYEYRLGDIDYNTAKYYHNNRIIRIEVIYTAIPAKYSLQPAYPNPFNPYTTITYSLPQVDHVRLIVYDINGNLVRELVNGVENPGINNVIWDSKNEFGEDVPSGMYIYTFQAANFKRSKKILLIR